MGLEGGATLVHVIEADLPDQTTQSDKSHPVRHYICAQSDETVILNALMHPSSIGHRHSGQAATRSQREWI